MTDRIIWLDGHVTTISSEEASEKQYEFVDEYSNEWRMKKRISLAIRKSRDGA